MTEMIKPRDNRVLVFWEERFFKNTRVFVKDAPTTSPLKKFFKDFCLENGGWYTQGDSETCRDVNRRDRDINYIEVIKDGKFICGSMEGSDIVVGKEGRNKRFHHWYITRDATIDDVIEWRKRFWANANSHGW